MSTIKMDSFLITLASCWVVGGAFSLRATATATSHMFADNGINDKVFTDSIAFESIARSPLDCARQCSQRDSCVTFTFDQKTCRGHHALEMQNFTSAPGARSYARNVDAARVQSRFQCKRTGKKRMTDALLELNLDVLCEDDWMVFQQRNHPDLSDKPLQEEFSRYLNSYITGFGQLSGDFWLGLGPLHLITTSGVNFDLRVEMVLHDNTSVSASYSKFSVGPATSKYVLNYDRFLGGSAGDGLSVHRGMQFSAWDADNDLQNRGSCAKQEHGGWWYNDCGYGLNSDSAPVDAVGFWNTSTGVYLVKSCQMMIRPSLLREQDNR